MLRATLVCAATLLVCAPTFAGGQTPARADGWVVIPVEDYRTLRLKAFPPEAPPDPPPVEATLTRVEYDLRVDGDSAGGEARLTVDVLKDGWVRVEIPTGLLVRAARVEGRPVPLINTPVPHVLLPKAGRAVLSLDVVVPLTAASGGAEGVTVPASKSAVSRLALLIPREGIDVVVNGGVIAERAQTATARWVAFGRTGQPLSMMWKKRTEDPRPAQPLKWRGSVTQIVGLGEEASPVTGTIRMEVTQGIASFVDVSIAEGLIVNQVSGALVSDWDFKPGVLKVTFVEPVTSATTFTLSGEARVPREGAITVPLLRLPAAEPETGGVAVDVLGAGEIGDRQSRGLDPGDPTDLGEALAGRDSPSMIAFRFRPQSGSAPRSLAVALARYTPQAVLIANVEEARYDVLAGEEGKTLVRARYAVRNNQRAFLALTLPRQATLWSAAVAGRPLRPGLSPTAALLLPLEKGRTGEDAPAFVVEVVYVLRGSAWSDKGRTTFTLPALDLPVSRTGIVLHHSPRFEITPEPGSFRVEADSGPFSDALRRDAGTAAAATVEAAQPTIRRELRVEDELVTQFQKDTAGRRVTGPLPVRVPFPEFGPSVFLMSELTAESSAPSLEFSYKREVRW